MIKKTQKQLFLLSLISFLGLSYLSCTENGKQSIGVSREPTSLINQQYKEGAYLSREQIRQGFATSANFPEIQIKNAFIASPDGGISILLPNGSSFKLGKIPAERVALHSNPKLFERVATTELRRQNTRDVASESDVRIVAGSDLRFGISTIKNQGERGTCAAFAFAAALEYCLGSSVDLSEQDIFFQHKIRERNTSNEDGLYLETLLTDSLESMKYAEERYWPYNSSTTCKPYQVTQNFACSETYHQGKKISDSQYVAEPEAVTHAKYQLKTAELYPYERSTSLMQYAKKALAKGYPSIAAIVVTTSFIQASTNRGMVKYKREHSLGYHAVLIVGHVEDESIEGGGYFIFKNSWGAGWGDHGIGYMSYEYAKAFLWELYPIKTCSDGTKNFARGQLDTGEESFEWDQKFAKEALQHISFVKQPDGSNKLLVSLIGKAQLNIFIVNLKGQVVRNLASGKEYLPGGYLFALNLTDLSKGKYIIFVEANGKKRSIAL